MATSRSFEGREQDARSDQASTESTNQVLDRLLADLALAQTTVDELIRIAHERYEQQPPQDQGKGQQ